MIVVLIKIYYSLTYIVFSPVNSDWTSVDICDGLILGLMDKFCYVGQVGWHAEYR